MIKDNFGLLTWVIIFFPVKLCNGTRCKKVASVQCVYYMHNCTWPTVQMVVNGSRWEVHLLCTVCSVNDKTSQNSTGIKYEQGYATSIMPSKREEEKNIDFVQYNSYYPRLLVIDTTVHSLRKWLAPNAVRNLWWLQFYNLYNVRVQMHNKAWVYSIVWPKNLNF